MNPPKCLRSVLAVGCLLILAACTQKDLPGLNVSFPIPVPAAPGALGPRLSSHSSGITTLSWMERIGDSAAFKFSVYVADAWQAPATVIIDPELFVNWADRPAVTPLGQDAFLAHWLRYSGGGSHAYDIVTAFSDDAGQTWNDAVSPHSDGTLTEHGFVSIYPKSDGAGLLWLDGRKMVNEVGDDPTTSGMTLRSAQLATDGTLSEQAVMDELVCDCCPTDVAMTPNGAIAIYRNRTPDEVRDIYIARQLNNHWQPGVAISNDNWVIAGCPVNGPSIDANEKVVVAAWFSAANDTPKVQAVFSTDDGRSFSQPMQIASKNTLGHVGTAVISDNTFAVSWLEADIDGTYLINIRTLTTDGQISEVVKVGRTQFARQVPELTRVDDKLLVAWTDEYQDASKIVSVHLPIVNFYDL